MALEVLLDRSQISEARSTLKHKGLSFIDSFSQSVLRRLGVLRGVAVGDAVKSWDVLSTIIFIEQHVQKNEAILDIGCYASELLLAIHKLGYSDLSGVDLNPNIHKMPHQNSIHYEKSNFMETKFKDASFKAITAISVIEHGFNGPALLQEMSRLLVPGGYFIASFDYWPEKIDTKDINLFDMSWDIFSSKDIATFVNDAARYGLRPFGVMNYAGKDKVIDYGRRQYTFAWMVLEKKL
jgi:SAM-dependent methyltransferase